MLWVLMIDDIMYHVDEAFLVASCHAVSVILFDIKAYLK